MRNIATIYEKLFPPVKKRAFDYFFQNIPALKKIFSFPFCEIYCSQTTFDANDHMTNESYINKDKFR